MEKEKIERILNDGVDELLCVFDFDKTLCYPFWKGEKESTTFSVFRDIGLISSEYVKESNDLFEHYYPKEMSTDLSYEERLKYMEEWWSKHLELFIKYKINKQMIVEAVASGKIHLRDEVKISFDLAHEKNIPILILSAGLGDVIQEVLKQVGINHPNVHIISNFYKFNEIGDVVGYDPHIIHSMNKNEKDLPKEMLRTFAGRSNVILAGDSLSDLHMTRGLVTKEVLSFGFLNGNLTLEQSFREKFDIVLLDAEESFKPLNNLLNKI
jgi:HAD superfamily hydrolase (TIGR01544 family)